ncbi:MAG: TonB-dependent receptor [Flavobacteriaceae bacterium]|nr:TonB-dependent receptor [Flavobacteriaceae bacterium]
MGLIKGRYYHYIVAMILFLFGNQITLAQNTEQPLLKILEQIEELYDVKFSYANEVIENIRSSPPDYTQTLPEILDDVSRKTLLTFKYIDERYIAITVSPDAFINLCAIIINGETLFPLEGATIEVKGTNQVSLSNSDGLFTLKNVQAGAQIEIRFLGFKSLLIDASAIQESTPCLTIRMDPQISYLRDVVLESIFAKGINKTNEGALKLDVSSFGNLPGLTEPDVLQMIQALPGVNSIDETISNINIRGGTTDENLILWDGIRMYQNGHFFGMISGFNPYLTESVSFYKNGTPARYGESVSGLISMHSSEEFPEKIKAGFQVNMINAGAFAKIPINEKLVIHTSGRRTFTDLLETPAFKQYFDKVFQDTEITNLQNNQQGQLSSEDDFTFYDFSLKAIYAPTEKDRFKLNFLTIDNSLDFTKTFTTENTQTSETSELDQNSIAGGLSWKRNWNEEMDTEILLYGTYYLLDASNLDIFSNQKFIQSNEVVESGAQFDFNWQFKENYRLSTGYQFTETGISNKQEVNIPLVRTFVKEVLLKHAVFISNFLEIENTQTSISAGLRLNYFQKFNTTRVEPRLNIHQKLGNGFALEAAFEQKSQTVTQRIDFQSDFLGVEKRRWVLANNDDVPIVNSTQYSFNVQYQKRNWLLQAEAYSKKVNDITSANQGFQNQLQFVRTTGNYETQGIELIINKKTKKWSSWLSYTYAKSDYTFDKLEPATFPHNFDIRQQATLAASYSFKNFKIASGINWYTGRPVSLPLSRDAIEFENGQPVIQFDRPNTARNEDYFRADVSVEYDFKLGLNIAAKINAAVLNVTNQKNILNTYFTIDSSSDAESLQINQVEQVSLGITPNVSLQILF